MIFLWDFPILAVGFGGFLGDLLPLLSSLWGLLYTVRVFLANDFWQKIGRVGVWVFCQFFEAVLFF